jgi:hypothetical protein
MLANSLRIQADSTVPRASFPHCAFSASTDNLFENAVGKSAGTGSVRLGRRLPRNSQDRNATVILDADDLGSSVRIVSPSETRCQTPFDREKPIPTRMDRGTMASKYKPKRHHRLLRNPAANVSPDR